MMYELTCQYDARQSFYKKAFVEVQKNDFEQVVNLYSYQTLVASRYWDFEKNTQKYIYNGKYSQTTTRHQKEFFKQLGLNDTQIKELFKNGILEV